MIKKLCILAAALALATFAFASTKSYNVSLTHPSVAGKEQLTPGDYKVKVDGSNAVFTDLKTSKSVTVPVKVQTGDKKFKVTAVDSTSNGSAERINAIELGGSSTKLEFSY